VSGIAVGLVLASSSFFLLVMLLHGELYALRPPARFLSRYYLVISAGGALGGAFVSLAAPFLFKLQFEYPLLLALALGLLLTVTFVHGVRLLQNYWLNAAATVGIIVTGLGMTIAKMIGPQALEGSDTTISYYRNVYWADARRGHAGAAIVFAWNDDARHAAGRRERVAPPDQLLQRPIRRRHGLPLPHGRRKTATPPDWRDRPRRRHPRGLLTRGAVCRCRAGRARGDLLRA
jgi:hypothetical protein